MNRVKERKNRGSRAAAGACFSGGSEVKSVFTQLKENKPQITRIGAEKAKKLAEGERSRSIRVICGKNWLTA